MDFLSKITDSLVTRWFYLWILILISFKLIVLPFSSHPFDFASYVYQAWQVYDFNLSYTFFWNKGLFLLVYFHVSLWIADLIHFLYPSLMYVNVLQFSYKFILLSVEMGTYVLIFKILIKLGCDIGRARLAVIMWASSLILYYVVSVHGQYVIFNVFFHLLSLFLLFNGSILFSGFFLGMSASIYYYAVLLLPVYVFYTISEKPSILNFFSTKVITLLFGFLIAVTMNFGPLFFGPDSTNYVSSLYEHSKPDASLLVDKTKIPEFSLYKFPYYHFTGVIPTNIDSPEYFKFVSKTTLLGILLVLVFLLYRLYIFLFRKDFVYTSDMVLKDTIVITSTFLVFLGKTQSHYFMWVLPVILLVAFTVRSYYLKIHFVIVSILLFVQLFTYQNLGLIFLNSIAWGGVGFWVSMNEYEVALLSFVLMISLFFPLLLSITTIKETVIVEYGILTRSITLFSLAVTVSLMLYISLQLGHALKNQEYTPRLISSNNFFRFPQKFKEINRIDTIKPDLLIFDDELKGNEKLSPFSRFIFRLSAKQDWYFYNVNNATDTLIQVDSKGVNGSIGKVGNEVQLSLGTFNGSDKLVLDQDRLYKLTVPMQFTSDDYDVKVTFRGYDGRSLDNIKGVALLNDHGPYVILSYIFRVPSKSYQWYEPVITFTKKTDSAKQFNFIGIKLERLFEESLVTYVGVPLNNSAYLTKSIIEDTKVSDKFRFELYQPKVPHGTSTLAVIMNNECERFGLNLHDKEDSYSQYYELKCFSFVNGKELNISYKNVDKSFQIPPTLFLTKKVVEHRNTFKD